MVKLSTVSTLTISLNWAGMVEGPHPVGLSDITGGSNLAAILDFFTLKHKFLKPEFLVKNCKQPENFPQISLSSRCTCDVQRQPTKMAAANI